MLSDRMLEWANDTWDEDNIENLETMDNQSVCIFAHEVAALEAQLAALREWARDAQWCAAGHMEEWAEKRLDFRLVKLDN